MSAQFVLVQMKNSGILILDYAGALDKIGRHGLVSAHRNSAGTDPCAGTAPTCEEVARITSGVERNIRSRQEFGRAGGSAIDQSVARIQREGTSFNNNTGAGAGFAHG